MTIYDLIAEARRENRTPSASRTLDILVVELGRTRDNLREAVANLRGKPLPPDGEKVLDRLLRLAERERIDDLYYAPANDGGGEAAIPLDDGTAGIGLLLGGTAFVGVALVAVAIIVELAKIFHWF